MVRTSIQIGGSAAQFFFATPNFLSPLHRLRFRDIFLPPFFFSVFPPPLCGLVVLRSPFSVSFERCDLLFSFSPSRSVSQAPHPPPPPSLMLFSRAPKSPFFWPFNFGAYFLLSLAVATSLCYPLEYNFPPQSSWLPPPSPSIAPVPAPATLRGTEGSFGEVSSFA